MSSFPTILDRAAFKSAQLDDQSLFEEIGSQNKFILMWIQFQYLRNKSGVIPVCKLLLASSVAIINFT